MRKVENIHVLERDHPDIFEWFMIGRIDILVSNIDFVLQTLKQKNDIFSNMIGSVDTNHFPWPMLSCTLRDNDGQQLTSFSKADFALFNIFTNYLKNKQLNLHEFKHRHNSILALKGNVVETTCLISPQFNQLPYPN